MLICARPGPRGHFLRLSRTLFAAAALATSAAATDGPKGTFASASGPTIWSHPELRGVLVRASWSSVEPSPGTFDFVPLRSRIAEATSRGKPYSLAIGAGGPGTPAWLLDTLGAPYADYAFRGTPMRLPLFWSPVVQERLDLLARRLGQELGGDPALRLVYVPQMTANGIEGHLNGVDMTLLASSGYTDDRWVEAALETAASFAEAFPEKALALEVHEVNGGADVPRRILDALGDDARFGGRVGGAIWWLSGRTDYQSALLDVLAAFDGTLYGQLIGRSDESHRFAGGDYRNAFEQAKSLGIRYLEPWEYDFGTGAGTADGAWDGLLRDFNAWADSPAPSTSTWMVPSSARSPGAGGSFYTSDLVLANPGGDATVTVRFLGHDRDGRAGEAASFVLAAGASRTFSDVLSSLFGEAEAWGALLVSSEEPSLIVLAQTSTPSGSGSFGQSVPAFGDGERLSAGGSRTIAGVRENASFRTNLVLSNAGDVVAEVDVALLGEDGETLARKRFVLPPFGMTQVTRVVRDLGFSGIVAGGRLVVSTSSAGASLAVYASLVDNTTNDPRTLLPR